MGRAGQRSDRSRSRLLPQCRKDQASSGTNEVQKGRRRLRRVPASNPRRNLERRVSMNDLQSLAKIAVIDDEMAAGLVSKNARADLAARVSAVPAEDVHSRPTRARRWLIARRRLIATVPVAVALSAAVLVIGLLARPGGPGGIISANAALVITKHGRSVDVIVRNPRA